MVDHFELRAIEQQDRLRLEVAPFYRHTTGTIRASIDPADMGKLINLGKLNLYGVDVIGRFRIDHRIEVGGAYDYIHASSDTLGADPNRSLAATSRRRLGAGDARSQDLDPRAREVLWTQHRQDAPSPWLHARRGDGDLTDHEAVSRRPARR